MCRKDSDVDSEAITKVRKTGSEIEELSVPYGLDPLSVLAIVGIVGFVAVAILIFLATKKNRKLFEDIFKKPEKVTEPKKTEEKTVEEKAKTLATDIQPRLAMENVEKLKRDLRLMDVEREIVGYALTRLYEAEAEGKITEQDRTQLLGRYENEMQRLDKEIEKKQMIVKLHDLEETKASLVAMFHGKLDEISRNIEGIRVALGILPAEPAQVKTQPPQPAETLPTKERKSRERPTPKPRAKSKTEERIEAVQEEVLKVLERLEQIEIEEEREGSDTSERGEEESGDSGS